MKAALASFPSRCAACTRVLSVPGFGGLIRGLTYLVLFLSLLLPRNPPQRLCLHPVAGRLRKPLFLNVLSSVAQDFIPKTLRYQRQKF